MAASRRSLLRPARVNVLDVDPDLADGLDPQAAAGLRARATAETLALAAGPWSPAGHDFEPRGHLGLLVLEGLLTRGVELAGEAAAELIAPGDIVRPWDDEEYISVPVGITWTALEPVRVAVLDQAFGRATAPWPVFIAALIGRYMRRSNWLALQLALTSQTRVEARLLIFFWNLGDRCGRMTSDGVSLPHRLTHDILGRLVGAHRQSVTTALGALAQRGLVCRTDDGWLLRRGDPRESLADFLLQPG